MKIPFAHRAEVSEEGELLSRGQGETVFSPM